MKAKNLIPPLVILAAWAWFFRELPGQLFLLRDAFQEFYPEWKLVAEQYRHGFFPLWNPYEYLGLPFLAISLPAAFYPLSALFCLPPSDLGFSLYIAVHYLLAGLFMWMLLRRLQLAPAAALIGAIAYMESGYLVGMQGTLNYLPPLAWLPLFLLAGDRFLARPRLVSGLCVAALFGIPFLVGDPLSEVIYLALLAVWFRMRRASLPDLSRKTFRLLAWPVIIFALLGAVQILPALELAPWSEKALGYSYAEITTWSFHPLRLLEWIFPGLFGYSWPENYFWPRFLFFERDSWWTQSSYFGLVPLLGLLLAFTAVRKRNPLGLGLLALLFLLLAGGRYTPLYKIFLLLPGLSSFRYPEKFLAPVTFLVCLAAALGLDQLETDPPSARPRRLRLTALLGAGLPGALAGSLYLLRGPLSVGIFEWMKARGYNPMPADGLAQVFADSSLHTLTVALLLGLLLLAWCFAPARSRWAPVALVLLSWLDLHTAHQPLLALGPASLFQAEPRAVQFLRQLEPGEFQSFRITRNWGIPFPRFLASGRPRAQFLFERAWENDTLLANRALNWGLTDYLGYSPARPQWVYVMAEVSPRQFWSLAGVKYLLEGIGPSPSLPAADRETLEEAVRRPELNLLIYRNPRALPRSYAVFAARWARDQAQAQHFLSDTDFARQVILLGSGETRPASPLVPAQVVRPHEQRLEVAVAVDRPGYLVLSDSYFPGWQARVNGSAARILPANYLVRAVAVPAGVSRVEFLYRPWAFRLGLWISLVTLSGIMMSGAWAWVQNQKPVFDPEAQTRRGTRNQKPRDES